MFRTFRKQIATGVLVLLPVITTILLVSWLFRLLDGILGKYFAKYLDNYIHGVGFLSLVLLIWLVGMISRTYIGSRLNRFKDKAFSRIPLVGNIFGAIKQVSDGFLEMDASSFEQVAMVEYPRKGVYSVGFVTSKKLVPFNIKSDNKQGRFAHVFMPTVPNPTSGYIILVPEEELYRLNLSVEDGLKLVLSLGMIYPKKYELGRFPSVGEATLSPGSLPEIELPGNDNPGT